MSQPWRLIVDAPQAGAWNMSVDEALLDTAAETGCTLRLYQWDQATLSLGYFQTAAQRAEHAASIGCPLVRRSSGGGAIVHDRELTYSLVIPAGHPLARQPVALYRTIHATLADVLTAWGLPAVPHVPQTETPADDEPFLCFLRRSEGDLIAGEHKIVGSAQRRRLGAVLQHGSILLARSHAAPELPGISDLASQPLDAQTLTELWLPQLQRALEITLAPASLPDRVVELARQLHSSRHADSAWLHRR